MSETTHIRVSPEHYRQIRQLALQMGMKNPEVLGMLIEAGLKVMSLGEPRVCVKCGKTTSWERLCDDCFYNPRLIRPAKIAAIYLAHVIDAATSNKRLWTFDEFAGKLTERVAKHLYGVRDDEWQVWREWLQWRQRFMAGEVTRETKAWRQWCDRVWSKGHCGFNNFWALLITLARAIGEGEMELGQEETGLGDNTT